MSTSSVSFDRLVGQLAAFHKLDLRGYKYSTLRRRTQRRMEQLRITDHETYLDFIRDKPGEVNELLHTVLINVTKFFRDLPAWEALRDEVLPVMVANHRRGEPLKIWCAGCSTGEEPYSVAMMLAEYFGPTWKERDIKIYATDQDEHALQVARRAEYKIEALANIPPEHHHRLVRSENSFRIEREIRRMVIFGRSNIIGDAPISHVNLLICRNLLIYFDPSAQRFIMNRLQYSVEPGGILFLGKSESQLRSSAYFNPIHARWRIFQRTSVPSFLERPNLMTPSSNDRNPLNDRAQLELSLLRQYHDALLETLEPGVLILDMEGKVVNENESVRGLWDLDTRLLGGNFSESILMGKCPEIQARLEAVRDGGPKSSRFECTGPDGKELAITVRAVHADGNGTQLGAVIYMEDITPRENLQQTVEQLQSTAEELQSSNEELETTNEELQSTNEELETTNEELQSTNEELETTNEELKSLNEELEDINEQLSKRTRELDDLNVHYMQMVERMPWPMLLAKEDGAISVYNTAAQELFGFATPSQDGMKLTELPMSSANRVELMEHLTTASTQGRSVLIEGYKLATNASSRSVRLHITAMVPGENSHGALVMFEPMGAAAARADGAGTARKAVKARTASGNAKATAVKAKAARGKSAKASKASRTKSATKKKTARRK